MDLPALPRPSPRTLLATGIGLLVLLVVGAGVWWWLNLRESRAAAAYAAALDSAQKAEGPQAPADARAAAASSIETALAQYPSAPEAGEAAYELGNLRFDQRDWAKARAAWEVAAARSTSPTIRTRARVGIGYAWEGEKNYPKAVEAFQAALGETSPGEFQYEDLLIDIARVQELSGKKSDAIETYRRLLKELPRSRRADDVRGRLASLGATP